MRPTKMTFEQELEENGWIRYTEDSINYRKQINNIVFQVNVPNCENCGLFVNALASDKEIEAGIYDITVITTLTNNLEVYMLENIIMRSIPHIYSTRLKQMVDIVVNNKRSREAADMIGPSQD